MSGLPQTVSQQQLCIDCRIPGHDAGKYDWLNEAGKNKESPGFLSSFQRAAKLLDRQWNSKWTNFYSAWQQAEKDEVEVDVPTNAAADSRTAARIIWDKKNEQTKRDNLISNSKSYALHYTDEEEPEKETEWTEHNVEGMFSE